MRHSFLLSFALGAGWLLSPEALVIGGNTAGNMGWLAIASLAGAALLLSISGNLLNPSQRAAEHDNNYRLLRYMTGTLPAIGLTLASSIPLVILAATALLVTSGYTFNEVFLYWFPNFGFSFLLLALLTLLQFFPEKIIFRTQICFVLLTAGALLFLALSGIAGTEPPVYEVLEQPGSFSSASSVLMLLLFTGSTSGVKPKHPCLVPIAGLVIFSLWILASLCYVNPERLASSTIPYMTVARTIMGEPGRQIMGVAIISGTCGAITGLMFMCRVMLAEVATVHNGNNLLSATIQRWVFPLLVALATGILMAGGLAGDELLETFLRGALILWLIHHSLLCLSAILTNYRAHQTVPPAGAMTTALFIAAVFILIVTNPQRNEITFFILSMLGTGGLIPAIWIVINKITGTRTTTQQTEKTL